MNIEQERSKFEEKFPVPDNCQWCGDGYAPTEFNAWEAKSYADKFKGWMARAALHSHDREDVVTEATGGDENGGHHLVEPDHETALALADAPRSLRNYVAALRSAIALQSQVKTTGRYSATLRQTRKRAHSSYRAVDMKLA